MGAIAIPNPTKLFTTAGIKATVGPFTFTNDGTTLASVYTTISSGYIRSDFVITKEDFDLLQNGETAIKYTLTNGCKHTYGKRADGTWFVETVDSSTPAYTLANIVWGPALTKPSLIDLVLSTDYNAIGYIYQIQNNNNIYYANEASSAEAVSIFIEESAVTEDPYQTAPDSTPDGGYGDYDYSGDDIGIPALPSWSITDSGFVTLYKPSLAQIKSLAQYLWTGIFDLATYKKIFADPMDCIISLSRVPIDADATGSQVLSVGNISTGLTFNVLSNQFVEVSFVSKNIGLRANGFLDYAPYVKVQLYLPFIGMRALSIDDIAGKVLTLKYQIDLFTGACTAYLKCKTTNSDGNEIDSVLYQFTGNVLANIPITQANYSSFIQSVIGAAAKTGSALISGGAAAAGAAALSSGINVAANIKPDIERSGNMTATGGFLGVKKPYLILTYPNICKPRNREKTVAIPSFIGLGIQSDNTNLKLSDFKGLTILHKINVKKIPCTEVERQMIETQLTTEGVIL